VFLEDIVTLSKWWSEEVVGLAVYICLWEVFMKDLVMEKGEEGVRNLQTR
jgi:hypothetical protein